MENKAHALAAGIFVALLSALVLALAAWLTRQTGVRDVYEISTKETVTGLQEQAPVRFRGVDVGKVKRIGFDPKVPGAVLVRMEIDRDTPMTTDTFGTLSYQGVTGLAFIQLSDHGRKAPALVPNDAAPPRIPLEPGLLTQIEQKGTLILDRVNTLLGDPNQKRIADALENISQAAAGTQQLVSHVDNTVQKKLDPALEQFTVTVRGAQHAVDQVGAAAAEFRTTAQRLNAPGGPLERVTSGTEALSETMETFSTSTLPRINRVADEATRTVRSLDRAINDLTENPQMLIYGEGRPQPGPGEPGFRSGGAAR
jgi:phospholipid/cholesterol/gamma-HCH transport system substrate-binding protein